MSTTAQTLLEAKYAENSQTTQYTAPAGSARVIIDKFTVTNSTAAGATLAVNLVPSGGAAGASNVVMPTTTVAPGTTELCPVLVGQILNASGFISTIAGTASALVIRISGRVVT